MRSSVMVSCSLLIWIVVAGAAHADDASPPREWPVAIAIWDPLGLWGTNENITGLSVGVLSSKAHRVRGIEVSGLLNRDRQVAGIQVAGLINGVGHAVGIQVAGLANVSDDGCTAIQISFFANGCGAQSSRTVRAIQLTGLVNLNLGAEGHTFGLQLAAFNNVQGEFTGIQIGAGNINGRAVTGSGTDCSSGTCVEFTEWSVYPGKKARGLQVGLYNSNQGFAGLQLGVYNSNRRSDGVTIGFVNLASAGARGLQIGVINYARRLRGVQIGVVNVAPDALLPYTIVVNAGF